MIEVHDIEPDAFRQRVRSFSFWLDAVRDYLPSEDGNQLPEDDVVEEDRDALITVLSGYCIGETAALEGAAGLIRIAPNRETKIFLATQVVDEARHLEVLLQRLSELGVEDPDNEVLERVNPFLLDFRERLLQLVDSGKWNEALFAQNVILESMEFGAFQHHLRTADRRTAAILSGIIKDERRHIGFGENELGRSLAANPKIGPELKRVRQELDYLVLGTFEHTSSELGMAGGERDALNRGYLNAVERLGFG